VKTTCVGGRLDNGLWKSSAVKYRTVLDVGEHCLSEKRSSEQANRVSVSSSNSCYSCCHSWESGCDRQVGAPSTVSRRADKTSSQRFVVKSSKEEFILP